MHTILITVEKKPFGIRKVSNRCWLASSYIKLNNNSCTFHIRVWGICVGVAENDYTLYTSNGTTIPYYTTRPVVPVISISSTIHTKKQIIDENNPDKVIWEVTE